MQLKESKGGGKWTLIATVVGTAIFSCVDAYLSRDAERTSNQVDTQVIEAFATEKAVNGERWRTAEKELVEVQNKINALALALELLKQETRLRRKARKEIDHVTEGIKTSAPVNLDNIEALPEAVEQVKKKFKR